MESARKDSRQSIGMHFQCITNALVGFGEMLPDHENRMSIDEKEKREAEPNFAKEITRLAANSEIDEAMAVIDRNLRDKSGRGLHPATFHSVMKACAQEFRDRDGGQRAERSLVNIRLAFWTSWGRCSSRKVGCAGFPLANRLAERGFS